MEDLEIVKGCQSFDDLKENIPNFFLLELKSFLLVIEYLLEQISSVGVLHDDAG